MKLKDLDNKQKMGIIIGIAVLVLASSGFLTYQMQLKKIKIMKNKIASLESKIAEVNRAKNDIGKFETELQLTYETLGKIYEKLPREKELPELLGKLAELASPFPTKDYVSVTPGNLKELDKYYKLPININMQCTYLNLQNYLQRLENLPRLVKIETIDIKPIKEDTRILRVGLEISIYYLK